MLPSSTKQVFYEDNPVEENHNYSGKDFEANEDNTSVTNETETDIGVRKSGMFGTIANISNTVIGAGILALPSSIAQVGWLTGLFLMIIGMLLTNFGLSLLFTIMLRIGGDQLSFGRVAERINKYLPLVASLLVFIVCFAVATLYLTLCADFLQPVAIYFATLNGEELPLDSPINNRLLWLSIPFFLLGAPLSIPRKITILQYTSSIAMLFIIYTTIIVVVYFFKPAEEICEEFLNQNNATDCVGEYCCVSTEANAPCCLGPVEMSGDPKAIIETFPVIITAFCCAPQAFQYYNDFINPTRKRLTTASSSALGFVLVLYVIISFFGYFTYGKTVSSDLLGSYPLTLEVTIARLGVAFLTIVSYPLLLQPARDSMVHMIIYSKFLITGKETKVESKTEKILFYSSLVVILAFTFFLADLNLDITVLLNLGGALSVANLSFTLPGIYYLSLISSPGCNWANAACYFMIVFGLLIMLLNIIFWII